MGRKGRRLNQVSEGSQSSPFDIASGNCMNQLPEMLRNRHFDHKLIYLLLKRIIVFLFVYSLFGLFSVAVSNFIQSFVMSGKSLTEDSASPHNPKVLAAVALCRKHSL
jgi:hypothetical protein